ncbi:MAG: helix-turn-helix domain-containing protein [Chloroflexota bacterium]|nr:helix-turn-helix domain-containing protein [Chloroflexota bacterium]
MTNSALASETLADRVRRLRLSRHMSMTELAYAAGVSKSHVHQIENGDRTRMRLSTLSKYARALGVPESYIDCGFGMARGDSQERRIDLTATLRRVTQLEDHHIQQVVGLIHVLEAEDSRGDLSRKAAASQHWEAPLQTVESTRLSGAAPNL